MVTGDDAATVAAPVLMDIGRSVSEPFLMRQPELARGGLVVLEADAAHALEQVAS